MDDVARVEGVCARTQKSEGSVIASELVGAELNTGRHGLFSKLDVSDAL